MNPPKNILVFDLKGPLAHFRKFYTNSSSLTYISPPRTVIAGLIAGILGRERDTFFEELDTVHCGIGLSLRTGVRKIMQTVNYIRTTDNDGYSSFAGIVRHAVSRKISGYPTPLELVLPVKPHRELTYRIYFSHHDEKVFDELRQRIVNNQYVYPRDKSKSVFWFGQDGVRFKLVFR
jgi:CRISPR-associated protein Cas5h